MELELSLLPVEFAVSKLSPRAPIPDWAQGETLVATVRTPEEFSVVCEASRVPGNVHSEQGWRALKVQGPLDFSLVGILARLSQTLAEAGVSVFAISSYDTDYILVKQDQLPVALSALIQTGIPVQGS